MHDIPADRRILESLLVQAMLESEGGNRSIGMDYAMAVLMMLDRQRDGDLVGVARQVLLGVGVRERNPVPDPSD